MNNNIKYNIFLLISTLSRNLVEVFNIALLYKLKYSIKEIFLYYTIFFLIAILVNIITIYITNYIKTKYILVFSNILFCFGYYYLNNMNHNTKNLIIFAIISSFSSYTYHIIRHYYALKHSDNTNEQIGNIAIFSFLGIIISSYLGPYLTERYNFSIIIIIIFILSLISIVPLLLIKDEKVLEKIIKISINKKRKLFFIFEQSKVLFLLIQPLFLYLYISNNLKYIGIFNIVNCIASIIVIYFVVRKLKINKYFKYINMLLIIILTLKLNITNKYIILLIAFFEGIFIKIYEIVSMKNLYQVKKDNIKSYLIKVEIIFCLTRTIFMLILYLFIKDIKFALYILLIFIFISGFCIKENKYLEN